MPAEISEFLGEIRGVNVRWVDVIVTGHTVERVASYDVSEAERRYGRPFYNEMDENIQMGMAAMDRISGSESYHKVIAATSYVLDGKCIRTAKIEHCSEIEPMGIGWSIDLEPWSCVSGTPPTCHSDLL